MSKFKEYNVDQIMLLPPSLHDYVPEGHLAKLVHNVTEKLDTKKIEDKYSEQGQNTYHPKILIKLLFYGYATANRSGRKIAQRCESDTAYIYLAQMYRPDFRTINDFRKNNIEELSGYFVDIVKMCKDLGLVKIGQVNIDGTKIKANAANRMTKDREGYEKWEKRIEKKINDMLEEAERIDAEEDKLYGDKRGDELPEDINTPEKLKKKLNEILKRKEQVGEGKKVNYTDPEAKYMKDGNGQINAGYNCQAAVTNKHIVVGSEVITEENDRKALELMVKSTEETVEEEVKEIAADTGYSSYENYEYLEENKKVGYIPDDGLSKLEENKKKPYHYENFKYYEKEDEYECPEGKKLRRYKVRRTEDRDRRWKHVIYKGAGCGECNKKQLCTKQKYRTVVRDDARGLVENMRQRLETKKGQNKYRKRMSTVEPVFGNIKYNLGYRYFLLRGLEKVRLEFRLMCIAHNLKRMNVLGATP